MIGKKQSIVAMLGIGGEPHPNMRKLKASFILNEMGAEALTTVLMRPHSPLGIGGEPHPNASKVEGLIHFRQDEGKGPNNDPNVLLHPIKNRKRTLS